jgi:hypothetical protein
VFEGLVSGVFGMRPPDAPGTPWFGGDASPRNLFTMASLSARLFANSPAAAPFGRASAWCGRSICGARGAPVDHSNFTSPWAAGGLIARLRRWITNSCAPTRRLLSCRSKHRPDCIAPLFIPQSAIHIEPRARSKLFFRVTATRSPHGYVNGRFTQTYAIVGAIVLRLYNVCVSFCNSGCRIFRCYRIVIRFIPGLRRRSSRANRARCPAGRVAQTINQAFIPILAAMPTYRCNPVQ